MFNHIDGLQFLEPTVTNEDGMRYYQFGDIDKMPSITSVLSKQPGKMKGLADWRKRIGQEKAASITRRASRAGTLVHGIIEKHLRNEKVSSRGQRQFEGMMDELAGADMFNSLLPILERIDNINALEVPLFSEHLGLAGRVDCIAEYNGELSVIDFKTSSKIKKKEWITDYFLQSCAYAIMWEERTKIPITQIVIIMAVYCDDPIIFIEHRDNWDKKLVDVIDLYKRFIELPI